MSIFSSINFRFVNKALIFIQEEEYKRLSEALAEDGSYNAVGFTYGSDYYDPSEPTEEEEPSRQRGEGPLGSGGGQAVGCGQRLSRLETARSSRAWRSTPASWGSERGGGSDVCGLQKMTQARVCDGGSFLGP